MTRPQRIQIKIGTFLSVSTLPLVLSLVFASAAFAKPKQSKRTVASDASVPSEVLTPETCSKKDIDLIETLQSTLKKRPVLDYGRLLSDEQKNDKDNPDLNWVRAVNPWDLPTDFPVRPGFIRCAGSLRTAVDTRTEEAIEEWNLCWKALYGDASTPAEFESISRCLTPKDSES